jgi:hypothetical protein
VRRRRDDLAVHRDLDEVVRRLKHAGLRGRLLARIERRAGAPRHDVLDPIALPSLVDMIMPREDEAHLVAAEDVERARLDDPRVSPVRPA